jgi:hypothetical protein
MHYKLYFQSCISMKILLFLILQNLYLTAVWTLVCNLSQATTTDIIKAPSQDSSVVVVLTLCLILNVTSFNKPTPQEVSVCILFVCHMTKPLAFN